MGKFKDEGDASLALAEECAEVIQVITKMKRFNGSWNEIPPGKNKTRWEELNDEMNDVIYQWEKLKSLRELETLDWTCSFVTLHRWDEKCNCSFTLE